MTLPQGVLADRCLTLAEVPEVLEALDRANLPVLENLGLSLDYCENPANDRTQ